MIFRVLVVSKTCLLLGKALWALIFSPIWSLLVVPRGQKLFVSIQAAKYVTERGQSFPSSPPGDKNPTKNPGKAGVEGSKW